jgi:hypothetical protein
MTSGQLYNHIRTLRSLRREMPVKPVRKTKKKQPQKQLSIESQDARETTIYQREKK